MERNGKHVQLLIALTRRSRNIRSRDECAPAYVCMCELWVRLGVKDISAKVFISIETATRTT